jgi:demethylmenaquinone methyltransferase/2-methoxy-6-polyprenyl-1,4-benzoquinol methylase
MTAMYGWSESSAIGAMFSTISDGYDKLNRFMSLGRDLFWRNCLSHRLLVLDQPGTFLDLATGTGDQIISVKKLFPKAKITGIDISEPMLVLAREKLRLALETESISNPAPTIVHGDALQPDFPAKTFDSVSISFGLRNIADREPLYRSVLSLLKPGGRFLVLELFLDNRSILAPFHRWHINTIIPFMAERIFRSSTEAYRYLGESVAKFPHPARLLDDLERVGFVTTGYRTYTFNVAMLVWGHKPLGPASAKN